MTRCVVDLGGESAIVGRTPWCAAPKAAVVGSLQEWDLEAIVGLHPTMLLVQQRTPDPQLTQVAAQTGATLVSAHVDHLKDIESLVVTLAEQLTRAGVPDAAARGAALLQEAADRRQTARQAGQLAALGPTLLLFSSDPPTAFGQGTYVAELWEALGGTNAIHLPGYPELSLEDVARLDPATVVLVRSAGTALPPGLRSLPPALQRRIRVVASPALLEPSTACLREGTTALAEVATAPAIQGAPAAGGAP